MHRPWGYYESIHAGERFQVKRITVNPGAKLSLQKHLSPRRALGRRQRHRERHARRRRHLLRENKSIFVPLGCMHRLENPGKVPLNLIEVQSGAYLGEDDIVRVQDIYRPGLMRGWVDGAKPAPEDVTRRPRKKSNAARKGAGDERKTTGKGTGQGCDSHRPSGCSGTSCIARNRQSGNFHISKRSFPNDAVTVDVGANCGLYTRKLARLSKQVHAFEPSGQMARLLRADLGGQCQRP